MKEVKIAGIAIDRASNTPVVLLRDVEEKKKVLPIWIGPVEAEAISQGLKNEKFSRPLTHDLLLNVLKGLKVNIAKVVVSSFKSDTTTLAIFTFKCFKGFKSKYC